MRKIHLLLLLFVFFGLNVSGQERILVDEVVAIVGNKPVLLSNIEAQHAQMRAQGNRAQDKCGIFEGLLFQKLLLAQAELDSIVVSDAEVESNLEMRLQEYIRQAGSEKALERYFNKTILEIKDEFRDVIRDQMITQRMRGEITQDITITPQEVGEFYNNTPKDSLPMVDAQLEIQQIMKRPPISRKAKEEARKKLEDLRKRILNGESFSTLAILYSQDPGSASNGGELGFANRADLDENFSNAAFNLREGQVSRIVESEFGMHIIQMIEKQNEDRINVRHILLIPQITADDKQKAKLALDSVAEKIVKNVIDFEEAAMRFSDDKNTRNNGGLMVNRYTGTSRFETRHISPEMNFALKNMKVGDVSQTFEAKDERGRAVYSLIKLKSQTKPHVANLKDDYQQIQEIALNFRKQEAIQQWMEEKVGKTYVKITPDWRKCKLSNDGWLQ